MDVNKEANDSPNVHPFPHGENVSGWRSKIADTQKMAALTQNDVVYVILTTWALIGAAWLVGYVFQLNTHLTALIVLGSQIGFWGVKLSNWDSALMAAGVMSWAWWFLTAGLSGTADVRTVENLIYLVAGVGFHYWATTMLIGELRKSAESTE